MGVLGRMCFVAALLIRPADGVRLSSPTRAAQCWHTNNGLVNEQGWDCEIYQRTPDLCGMYDGNGFISMDMCCACNGGYWEEVDEDRHLQQHQDPCLGYTCDQWIESYPTYTCPYLTETFGCDCSASSCISNCPATCNGNTCDELIDKDHSLTCGLLQHSYGCDCHGCECKAHEVALTDGYNLLTHETTGTSGDCMKHCVGCDHTWLPHNVKSVQNCRALCDENYNDAGIEKWCYAYSWEEEWSTCRLYHEVPDGPTDGRFENMLCYVKAAPSFDENYVNSQNPAEDVTDEQKPLLITTAHAQTENAAHKKDGEQQEANRAVDMPKHELGLVNNNLWAHYAMTASLTFKITNTFVEPSACLKTPDACLKNQAHLAHRDVLTFQKKNEGAYSRHSVVFGGGDLGTSKKVSLFKPNVVNMQTTWRVADVDNDDNIHFTIQKRLLKLTSKWYVYRGRKKDEVVAYYAIEVSKAIRVYKDKATFKANADDWSAAVVKLLPSESNGQSVLGVTVKPGEDTLTAWAIYHDSSR